ncbi:MAG: hypothetical protein H8E45_01265 [Proteobacteria bacterium]|nr:hypothetical protein [Pseudomonadota bacterium]
MKKFTTTTALVAISALFLLAGAQQADAALSKADQGCRGTIAKGFGKLAATADKTIAGCHKSRDGGKIPDTTDCNLLAHADTKGKVVKAANKLIAGIAKKCPETGSKAVTTSLIDGYLSCPEPCGTNTGVPNTLTSFSDLGQCLACLGGDVSEGFNSSAMGAPVPSGLSKTDSKCHGTIAKGYGKLAATIVKDRAGCQKGADKTGDGDTTACSTSDAKGKIAKALAKAEAGLDKSCAAADLALVASCATDSLANLKICLANDANAAADELFAAAYSLDATICPTGLVSTLLAGVAPDGTVGRSSLKSGWTGVGHGADLPHGYKTRLHVDCGAGASPPCGDCTVTGAKTTGDAAYNVRCRDDMTVTCTNAFGIDASCPGVGNCDVILSPPLPLSAGSVPVCVVSRIATDYSGTANNESGSADIAVMLRSVVHTGITVSQPCPNCQGDTTFDDGAKDGTCSGGPGDGLSCDTQAEDATFGPVSLDCPPDPLANVTGQGLIIDLSATSGNATMNYENQCDAPLNAFNCACGVCSGDTTFPCRNNTECSDSGLGTCTAFGAGTARKPNGCADAVCSPDPADPGMGVCLAGPSVTNCDGAIKANGLGYIGCSTDFDCDQLASECPNNDCGNCTLVEDRSCFLDPIVLSGVADPDNPLLATTFCIPPAASVSINNATGLPGPGRVLLDSIPERTYD